VPITVADPFKGRQYPAKGILQAVRWYLRYPLAYERVTELLAERGLAMDASCVWRWAQVYSPELNRRCQPHFKRTNKSYRVDETCIKVKGQERYLYRAVDSTGQTIDFLRSAKRDFGLCDLGMGFPEIGSVSLSEIAAARGQTRSPSRARFLLRSEEVTFGLHRGGAPARTDRGVNNSSSLRGGPDLWRRDCGDVKAL
jgi:transposase, IS6 family